ncbi:hypothetical protein QL285_039014 [Trifolium repens]|nr:hypothetical protein QL285_039014 [Trifolium repens]
MSTKTASSPTLIPDFKHFKETMENMQKQIDALRGDVDQVTDKLDRVLEILANLSLPSRVDAATVGANPPIGSPLSKLICPSSDYTSAVAQDTQEPMGTNTELLIGQPRTHQVQPRFAMPQSSEDHMNAHQGNDSKGKSVASPSEETRQKFKAIEDKLRIMESFLPSNVSPPHSHSRSTVSTRTPCFNHPTVVQPQQSQGFSKQAIQTPLNHSQSGQVTQNLGHQQNPQGPRSERRNVHYDRIPMPYGHILPHLLQKGLVQLKPLDPVSPPYPPGFYENARCDYHNGSLGHNIENCRGFKHKVQELIDQKLLNFKEDEANAATFQNGPTSPARIPCLQYPYRAAAQHQQPQGYSFQEHVNLVSQRTQQVQQTQQQVKKVFDLIPVSYSQLLPYLVHNRMVTPRALRPMTAPFPVWYDTKAKCEFHSGAEGHNTDNCRAFKRKVQELIDQKRLTFKG